MFLCAMSAAAETRTTGQTLGIVLLPTLGFVKLASVQENTQNILVLISLRIFVKRAL